MGDRMKKLSMWRRLGGRAAGAVLLCLLWLFAGNFAWAGIGALGGGGVYGAGILRGAEFLYGPGISYAAEQRVFDQAGLFSEDETAELESEIERLRGQMNMDVVLVTADYAGGKTAEEYADDFYDEGGFGSGKDASGVLFLIDMDNRELYISTCGAMIRFLTDERIDSMLDRAIGDVASGAYGSAAEQLLADMEYWYRKGIPGGQYNYDAETGTVSRYRSIRWYEALAAVIAAAVCAGGACLSVKQEYAMKRQRRQASNYMLAYRANARFALQDPRDVIINSFVTQRIIPRTTSGGSRGGGRGGSSGRSTTHRSSSGRSHGGGGRRF